MQKDKRFVVREEIAWRKMKDGTVTIVSPLTDKIISVNETAGMIWEKLDGTNTVSNIVDALLSVFGENDVERRQIFDDTVEILESFISRELIEEKIDSADDPQ